MSFVNSERNKRGENAEDVEEVEIMEAMDLSSSPKKKKKKRRLSSSRSHGYFDHENFDRTETMDDSVAEFEQGEMQNEVIMESNEMIPRRKKKKKKHLKSEVDNQDFGQEQIEAVLVESTELQEEESVPVSLKKKKKKKKYRVSESEDFGKQRTETVSVENTEIGEEKIVPVSLKKKKKKKKEKRSENVREFVENSETTVDPNSAMMNETIEETETDILSRSSKKKKKKEKKKESNRSPDRSEFEGNIVPVNSRDPDNQLIPVSVEKKKKKKKDKKEKESYGVTSVSPDPIEMEREKKKKKKKRIKAETEVPDSNFENVENVTKESEMTVITQKEKKKKIKLREIEDQTNENIVKCFVVSPKKKKKKRKRSRSVTEIAGNGENEDSMSPCYPGSMPEVVDSRNLPSDGEQKKAFTSIKTLNSLTSVKTEDRQTSQNTSSPLKSRNATSKVFITPRSDGNVGCEIKTHGAKNIETNCDRRTESQENVQGLLAAFGQNPLKNSFSELKSSEHSRMKFSDNGSNIDKPVPESSGSLIEVESFRKRSRAEKRRISPDTSSDSDTSSDIPPPKIPRTSLLTSRNGIMTSVGAGMTSGEDSVTSEEDHGTMTCRGNSKSRGNHIPVTAVKPKSDPGQSVLNLGPNFPVVRPKPVTSQSPSTSQASTTSQTMPQSPLLTSRGSQTSQGYVPSLRDRRYSEDPLRPVGTRGQATTPPDSALHNRFSPDEDLVLRANWASFCSRVSGEVEDPSSLVLQPSPAGSRQLALIQEYRLYATLQRGLSKNKLQCYSRLQLLLEEDQLVARRGKLSRDELRQMASLLRQHGPNWRLIGRALHRSARSVKNLARKHWENVCKPGRVLGRWSADEDEQLLRAVRARSGHEDLASLSREAAARLDWAKVSAAHGSRTRDQCWHRWTEHLSYHVRGLEPRPPNQAETASLLAMLADCDVTSFSLVPWARLAREFPENVPVSNLRRKAIWLRRRVPDYRQLTWQQCLARMTDDCGVRQYRRRVRETSPDNVTSSDESNE